ncbi:MAG: zinc-ribbon domain-containing protein [Magnetococcales bacterium]|nr:zinc-ribbon domain-containing protein [Magnetococcales bacterium]
MIVQCESCRAQFDVDDDILRPSGRKLKCSQCQAVFFQPAPKSREAKGGDAPPTKTRAAPDAPRKPSGFGAGGLPAAPDSEPSDTPTDDEETILGHGSSDENDWPDSDTPLGDGEVDDGLDGLLDEIQVEDAFGPGIDDPEFSFEEEPKPRPAPPGFGPSEISAEEALGEFFGDSDFSEENEPPVKSGLIDTYLREEEEEDEDLFVEEEPAPAPVPPARSAPSFVPPMDEDDDDDSKTILSSATQLALGKPTARELELARLAKEKPTAPPPPPPPAPVKPEPVAPEPQKESFIKVEPKWDADEVSIDDEEEPDEEPPPAKGGQSALKLWLVALLLLLTLGVGLTTLTDWWSYHRFDLFSDYRFTEAKGEWRRYPHGMLLTVSGSLVNTGRVVRTVPGIRVVLLDEAGMEVGSVMGYPGRVIEDKLLDESSEATLRTMAGLQGEEKRLKMNKLVPGNATPFQVLFVKPPAGSTRFRLQLLLPEGKGQVSREKSLPDKSAAGAGKP